MTKADSGKSVSDPDALDFAAWRKRIRKTYEAASASADRPRERQAMVLRDMLYRYYRALKEKNAVFALKDFVLDRDQYAWERHRDGGPVWVVRLIEHPTCDYLEANLRSRLYYELELADHNDVNPDMLLAFLYEAGGIDVIKRDWRARARHDWAKRYR